jgi:Tol biopolymer transport system component
VSQTTLDFLTHQPISGQLLSERLAAGALAADETLRFAIELGGVIGKIHSRGQVHCKICPQTVIITSTGLRLLEAPKFGDVPVAYNAPEQTRGEAGDARSDVWSFGAVVYHMASGRTPFAGTGMDLKRAIQSQQPAPLDVLSGSVLEGVIYGCLEKDPAQRRQRIQNAVIELKLAGGKAALRSADAQPLRYSRPLAEPEAGAQPAVRTVSDTPALPKWSKSLFAGSAAQPVESEPEQPETEIPTLQATPLRPASAVSAPRPVVYTAQGDKLVYGNGFKRRIWMIGGAAALLLVTGAAAAFYLHQKPSAPVLKFAVTQPEHTSYPGMPAVSPDGRYLTFSAVGPEGKRMLWLRPLDALHATVIAGTEGASAPFWSPDSQYIGFFASLSLKKVRLNKDVPPEKICDAEATPGGGAWGRDGDILFARSLSDGFWRVPSTGGKPQQVLKPADGNSERGALWPQMLPDGKHFIFYMQTDNAETAGVYVGDTTGEHHRLFTSQTNAVYSLASPEAKSGYLVYINERNLTALQFNAAKLETVGDPIILANDIGAVRSLSLAPISVSNNGVLVYQGVGQPTRQMIWLDRSGKQLTVAGEPGEYGPPRVSPDGNRGIVAKIGSDGKTAHLWLLDRTGAAEQLTHTDVHEGSPVWSPDGTRIAHFAQQGTAYDLFIRPAIPDSKPDLIVKTDARKYPTDWSRDGKYVLYGLEGEGTRLDVWGFSTGDRRAAPILNTVFAECFAAVSPDGKWIAYQSDQTGRNEVYVQPFDGLTSGTKRRWQVSKGGGLPRWANHGNELFYITQDGRMMVVPIRITGDAVESDAPQLLFQTRPVPKTWNLYDVTPDGQRFLFNLPLEWTSANPITVVTNWTEKLKDE